MDFRALLKHKEDEKKRRNAEDREKVDLKHNGSLKKKCFNFCSRLVKKINIVGDLNRM
jgi:hypothetical protein